MGKKIEQNEQGASGYTFKNPVIRRLYNWIGVSLKTLDTAQYVKGGIKRDPNENNYDFSFDAVLFYGQLWNAMSAAVKVWKECEIDRLLEDTDKTAKDREDSQDDTGRGIE